MILSRIFAGHRLFDPKNLKAIEGDCVLRGTYKKSCPKLR